jgi:RNA polymerase sigma factor (sigma-70 family)
VTTRSEPARERKLLRAAKGGDTEARQRIVASKLRLVRAIAARYCGMGVPLDDLVQEGTLGLVEAIDRHDPRRGDFDTFARFRIRRSIRNALTEQARVVRLPKQVVERRRVVAQVDQRLTRPPNGDRPSVTEIVSETGLPPAAVLEARRAPPLTLSLDEPVLPDGTTRENAIADATAPDPHVEAVEHERTRLLRRALGRLGKRQRRVVSRHYGLDEPEASLTEIAADLHLSPQRTRAIEADALYELRELLEGAGLEP